MIDMSKRRRWPGLKPLWNRFMYGGVKTPKLKRVGTMGTPTGSEYYEGMEKDYRWFRQDELVRRCIVTNALFATMTGGFETELEPVEEVEDLEAFIEEYRWLKKEIDSINKRVNLDQVLFISQVKRSIYGCAGWEIILEKENGVVDWLLSLQSNKLKPSLDEDWELTGYKYEGREGVYDRDEVLYFTNLQLENDYQGLSDVEPIRDVCDARHRLLREDFPEIVRTLWAPYIVLEADTSGMTPSDEDAFLDALIEAAKSGKSLAFNQSVEAQVVDHKINFQGLVSILEKFEQSIIAEFGTPRFLLGKPVENRATAYAELEGYVQGVVANIQRYFKREVERQWYDRWTRQILGLSNEAELPVHIKHVWTPVRVIDVYEMAEAVAALYATGLGILADYEDLAFEMMGWPKERLQEEQRKREERRAPRETDVPDGEQGE